MAYAADERAEIIAKAIELVDEGKSLRQACAEIGFPRKTVEMWIDADPELSTQYLRARANRAEKLLEEALSIQDERPDSVIQLGPEGEGGTKRIDPAFVSWQANRVNLRMRMIAKMDPKRYGDRVELEHSGEVKSSAGADLSKLSVEELATLRALRVKAEPDAAPNA